MVILYIRKDGHGSVHPPLSVHDLHAFVVYQGTRFQVFMC